MTDADAYIRALEVTDSLMAPVIRPAIQALQLPLGSRGLDAGCGIGLQALLLAEAVGPSGHVTGLDISAELLSHAEGIANRSLSRMARCWGGSRRLMSSGALSG